MNIGIGLLYIFIKVFYFIILFVIIGLLIIIFIFGVVIFVHLQHLPHLILKVFLMMIF